MKKIMCIVTVLVVMLAFSIAGAEEMLNGRDVPLSCLQRLGL